ncbi:hypothetical protein E4U41_006853 [Claviceps citrina]|nr:hypothetical protein E4U41_006853 [Claviceps citrina]
MFWLSLLPVLAYSHPADATPVSASTGPVAARAAANVHVTVDTGVQFQEMDGLGVSQAFQRAYEVFGSKGLSRENTAHVLDLLFSLDKGAGFAILRNAIGTSDNHLYGRMKSIEPVSPGHPGATPSYVWDRNDTGQFPLAQEAYKRGLKSLYGSAWSAPPFMKTSQNDVGGHLCGVTGFDDCPTGNWIKPYADFLLKWVGFYKESGVKVTELGFLNEPELTTTYVSMLSDGKQAADLIRVLGPEVKAAGLDLKLTCCDSVGWQHQQEKMEGLQAGPDPAEAYLDIITGHGYASAPTFPLKTSKKTWQTEWSDLSPDYTPHTFYDNGAFGEGLTWAANIQTSFVKGNVSAFLYWIGAENGTVNTGLINLVNDQVIPTKRFWAHAQFSKFARPGARRVSATSQDPDVTVSSFLNTDGKIATQVINNGTAAVDLDVEIAGAPSGTVLPYLTDNDNDLTALPAIQVSAGRFSASVPARSLVSFVMTKSDKPAADKPAAGGKCKAKSRHHKKAKATKA